MNTIKELQAKAIQIRKELLQVIVDGNTGHTGGSLSCTDILVALFYCKLKHDPQNPKWEGRDRFLLSKGHSVEGYYSILADIGYFPKEELKTFSKFKSRLIGHPSTKVPGVEMNTGSLGHGLPIAVGMAKGFKMQNRSNRVYVLMGDGEQAEGSIWEGAMAAANYNLDNLVAIVDRNHLQISGNTEDVIRLEDFPAKWRAFGWEVTEIDGNDMGEIISALDSTSALNGKPHMIIAHTTKGKGVSFMENVAKWHHGVPTAEQLKQAWAELDEQLAVL